MLSRLEEGGKILVIMTRWHSADLAGRVLEWCKEAGKKYRHIKMSALQDKEKQIMLCPEILSYGSYQDKISAMGDVYKRQALWAMILQVRTITKNR